MKFAFFAFFMLTALSAFAQNAPAPQPQMPTAEQMKTINQQMQQMMNDPAIQQQMQEAIKNPQVQEMLKQQGAPANIQKMLQQNATMMNESMKFMECVDEKAGAGTAQKMMNDAMKPEFQQYMQSIVAKARPLCEAGKKQAANNYVEKSMKAYMTQRHSAKMVAVGESCETAKMKQMKQQASVCDTVKNPQKPVVTSQ